jgi:hypothetical protein
MRTIIVEFTPGYLEGIKQDQSFTLPEGPVFLSPASLMQSLKREVGTIYRAWVIRHHSVPGRLMPFCFFLAISSHLCAFHTFIMLLAGY